MLMFGTLHLCCFTDSTTSITVLQTEELLLHGNESLSILPEWIGGLNNLKSLEIHGSNLTEIPDMLIKCFTKSTL